MTVGLLKADGAFFHCLLLEGRLRPAWQHHSNSPEDAYRDFPERPSVVDVETKGLYIEIMQRLVVLRAIEADKLCHCEGGWGVCVCRWCVWGGGFSQLSCVCVCACTCVNVCVRVCLRGCQADQKALAISLRCRASPHSPGGSQINLRCAAGSVLPASSPLLCLPPSPPKKCIRAKEKKRRGMRGQGRGEEVERKGEISAGSFFSRLLPCKLSS